MTAADDADDRKYRAPALEKGLDVLELLSAHGQPLTPSQMSATLGRSVSELFRMIQVLEFRGYIEQSSDGYRLTNRLFTVRGDSICSVPAKCGSNTPTRPGCWWCRTAITSNATTPA